MKALKMSLLLSLLCLPTWAQERTIRFGEQDTCSVIGVCSVTNAKDWKSGEIRFDLSKLRKGTKVVRAHLRMWMSFQPQHAGDGRIKPYSNRYLPKRWLEEDFDGFKLWQVGSREEPLDTVYPFTYTLAAIHEWDVTVAVQSWIADPETNQGMKANAPFIPHNFALAWMRPYLEITIEGDDAGRPKQPAKLNAKYRSGQVFLTWEQISYDGAFCDSNYRIYMHDQPITGANLRAAKLLGEVHKNSQLNYRRTVQTRGAYINQYAAFGYFKGFFGETYAEQQRINFVIDDTWPEKIDGGKWLKDDTLLGKKNGMHTGPELSNDTGLFVHTIENPGPRYFAVTSVVKGFENKRDFGPGNSSKEIDTKVDAPKPVLQTVYYNNVRGAAYVSHMLEYVFWGGPSEDIHSEPSTPIYFRLYPSKVVYNNKPFRRSRPENAWTTLGGSLRGATVGVDLTYVPPTRLAPMPPNSAPWASWNRFVDYYRPTHATPQPREVPLRLAWHIARPTLNRFGYHDRLNTGENPRKATVRPYAENRLMRCLEYYFQTFPQANRKRVAATGQGNTLMLGLHHPKVIASVGVGQEELWGAKYKAEREWRMVGLRQWNLKTPDGDSVWDWNDPVWYSRKFPTRTWPMLDMLMSPNYARADQRHWNDCGYPGVYLELSKDKRGGRWWWCDIGDAPSPRNPAVPLDEAYLAFTNVNFGEVPVQEWRRVPRGSLNGYLIWQGKVAPQYVALAPYERLHKSVQAKRPEGRPHPYGIRRPDGGVNIKTWTAKRLELSDDPDRFAAGIRIGDNGRRLNGQSVPPTEARYGKTDITLWRLQKFKVEKGKKYLWTNRKPTDNALIQSGVIEPDDRNLLTVPGFCVDRSMLGTVLEVVPLTGEIPQPNPGTEIEGEKLAAFVARCEKGIELPRVTATQPVVIPINAGASGGNFGKHWAKFVEVESAGRHVIEAKAKGTHSVAWPLLSLAVHSIWGPKLGALRLDSPELRTYRWVAELPAGSVRLRLSQPAEYYMVHTVSGLKEKKLHVESLTVRKIEDDEQALQIDAVPGYAVGPVNMPVQFQARTLMGDGNRVEVEKVIWSSSGGTITPAGLFTADKPGKYSITAKAGGLSDTATIITSDKMMDDFNEGSGYLDPAWSPVNLGKGSGRWQITPRGHHFLTSMGQQDRQAETAMIWSPGSEWADYHAQVDMIARTTRPIGKWGILIRATDEDSHYRFEIERIFKKSKARIVKRQAGVETELATSEIGEASKLDWQTNRMCTAWNKLPKDQGDKKTAGFRMDRMRITAKGSEITCYLNGKEVMKAKDDNPLEKGAPGLYSRGLNYFDNFEACKSE
ncbi:MAG: hypothetical protein QGG53_07135 [Planctomycetota bacterium]|nr:hypothetical protein [Planctomycetota bacterium]